MKKAFYIMMSLFALTLAISSCSFETDTVDGDGNMEGMWHLERVTRATAGDDSVEDLSNKRIFWKFQHDLLQLQDYDGSTPTLLCRFNIASGQLSLHDFSVNTRYHDTLTTNMSYLAPYRIYSVTPTYNYTISGSRLTLRTDSTTMSFKRF